MSDKDVRQQLIEHLGGKGAHVDFESLVKDFPTDKTGIRPEGFSHSAWELLEHLRIAQWDILEFSRNPEHESPDWPDGYWPESPQPPDSNAWDKSVASFESDLEEMQALVGDESIDLFTPFEHGDGQTVMREALILIKHNSYHLGQLADVRKALGEW